ncbi:ATP-binding cassette domain-containing protein [Rhodohalobacter sp. SW132]|uniref:ATP-binding cassette domain-containing protein n=1 Tax=Rhodohalobacter sp. SW132 TaxID=2293433 RepID=UPI000E2376A7|nr:ATP-binding cassette domain-containing protein [Rhodohalobacter sp. SW132]REL24874.1 ATP-binding cassette domain-containing protein [Rhodohalobacter sp. SW132]
MLSFHSVVKRFDKIRAVDDLSFSMQKGEIFALLGPNGAGKTSCVRMIMQVMSPDSGTIEFDESLLNNGSIDRSKLGYLPEEHGLYQNASLLKPDSFAITFIGIFPLTSYAVLPARMVMTQGAWWEPVLAIVLLAGTAWIFRLAAGKIFSTAMLMYGKEPTLKEMAYWFRKTN